MVRIGWWTGGLLIFLAAGVLPGEMPDAAEAATSFRQALPGYPYRFPRDLASHDDFRIEWWYYTGNLEEKETGRPFGYELTFFRVALEGTEKNPNPSRWKIGQVYFAHMAIADLAGGRFYPFERINRKGLINAGAESDRLLVWNEDWVLFQKGESHRMKAVERGTGLDLKLTPLKKLVFHGREGISRKGKEPGNASHYFSYTRMKTSGKIFVQGKEYRVRGTSWMDREFSSNQVSGKLEGWDWFSLKLDNNVEIMLYQLRQKDGGIDPFSSGTMVLADGASRPLAMREFSVTATAQWTSRRTGITYPAGWVVTVPGARAQLTVTPELADQELAHLRSISGSYWEGSVSIRGTYEGQKIRGRGYVELVGYGKPIKQDLPE